MHGVYHLLRTGDRDRHRRQVRLGVGECVLHNLARVARSGCARPPAGDGGEIRIARLDDRSRPANRRPPEFWMTISSIEVFLSGGGGVIPAATTVPVLPNRLAALAPTPSAGSINNCQPVSIASSSSDTKARATRANSTVTAPDVPRAFIWRSASGRRSRSERQRLHSAAVQPTAACPPGLGRPPAPAPLQDPAGSGHSPPGHAQVVSIW